MFPGRHANPQEPCPKGAKKGGLVIVAPPLYRLSMPAKELTGRARLPMVMERAFEIAAKGDCLTFNDVRARMNRDDATTLKLWAGATEYDRINAACREGNDKRLRTLGIKTGRSKPRR